MAETHVYSGKHYGKCPHCGTFRRVSPKNPVLPKHNRYVGLQSRPGSSRGRCPGSGQKHEIGEITKPHWQVEAERQRKPTTAREHRPYDMTPHLHKTAGDLDIEKVADPTGHYHDERGRFARRSASTAGVPAHVLEASHNKPHFVMTGGGAGSGKGALVASYTGGRMSDTHVDFGPNVSEKSMRLAVARRHGVMTDIPPSMPVEKPRRKTRGMITQPLPTFDESRVIDPDSEKKALEGLYVEGDRSYHPTLGTARGASGPRNKEEFESMDDAYKAAALNHLGNMGYGSLEEFTSKHPSWQRSEGNPGGLTHEISSVRSKLRLEQALHAAKEGSVIYDQVGNFEKAKRLAEESLANGFGDFTYHFADSPLEVNHENNSLRKRVTSAENVISSYHRARNEAAKFANWARGQRKLGRPIYFLRSQMASQRRIAGAQTRGWTPGGRIEPTKGQRRVEI